MRSVESIIGGYIVVSVIIAVLSGLVVYYRGINEAFSTQFLKLKRTMAFYSTPPHITLNVTNGSLYLLIYSPIHPNSVKVIGYGEHSGVTYFVEEYSSRDRSSQLLRVRLSLPENISEPICILVDFDGEAVFTYDPRKDPAIYNLISPSEQACLPGDVVHTLLTGDPAVDNYMNSTPGGYTVLDEIGYKVLFGYLSNWSNVDYLIYSGPINCPSFYADPTEVCNVRITFNDTAATPSKVMSYLTYSINGSRLWRLLGSGRVLINFTRLAELLPQLSTYTYVQASRALVVSGYVDLSVSLSVSVSPNLPRGVVAFTVYVLPPWADLAVPVAISSAFDNYVKTQTWLSRRVLYASTLVNQSVNATIDVSVNASSYGLDRVLVLISVEMVVQVSRNSDIAGVLQVSIHDSGNRARAP